MSPTVPRARYLAAALVRQHRASRLARFNAELRSRELEADRDAPTRMRPGVAPQRSRSVDWVSVATWFFIGLYCVGFAYVACEVVRGLLHK